MKFNKNYVVVALALQTLLTGCASITKDANQQVKVETYTRENEHILGATCTAKNVRGEWKAETPNAMPIRRSGDNLLVTCDKEGYATGLATVISRANGGMFGNILLGGGIGAIIDHNKGTAYSYPDWIRVILGDNLVYDRKNNKDNEVMLGQSAIPEELKRIEEAKEAEQKVAKEKAAKENAGKETAATEVSIK